MIRTLLVTNDFPPKVGGIQSYLEELWRRLDPGSTAVLTATSSAGAAEHDRHEREAGGRIHPVPGSTPYVPTPRVRRAVDRAVAAFAPDLVLYDPYVPLGLIGRRG